MPLNISRHRDSAGFNNVLYTYGNRQQIFLQVTKSTQIYECPFQLQLKMSSVQQTPNFVETSIELLWISDLSKVALQNPRAKQFQAISDSDPQVHNLIWAS